MRNTLPVFAQRAGFAALLVATLMALARPAYAQQTTSTSVEGALQAHFADASKAADAAVLRDAGYGYERLLVAEMLPSGSTLFAEVELARGDTRLRYPIKLKRLLVDDELLWQVDWTPVEAYAQRLVEIAGEDGLAAIDGVEASGSGTNWADIERLPSFPMIVGEEAFVTPYGSVAVPAGESEDKAQLQVPEDLGKHAQRWVGLTLEDEPGTANVDLLLEKDVAWTRATQALMAPASLGLFRTYLVGRAGGSSSGKPAIVALATAAPVVRQTADGAEPLVVGMYQEGDQHAFRIRIGDDVVEEEEACGDEMAFCLPAKEEGSSEGSLESFEQQALDQITAAIKAKQTKLAYVMFAATGEFGAGEVARHVEALGQALGMPSSKIFIGYIGEE